MKIDGVSEEKNENMTKSDRNFSPNFVDDHLLSDVNFNGRCLKNNIFIPRKVIYIFFKY